MHQLRAPPPVLRRPRQFRAPSFRSGIPVKFHPAGSATLFEASPIAPTPRRRPTSPPPSFRPGPVSRGHFGRPGPGQPPPASGPSGQRLSLAERPAPPPAMSGITPGLSAEAACLLAVAPDELPRRWKTSQPAATLGAGHPSTHGAASRRRTGTVIGPTSAWLFAGTAARAVRSTAAPTSRSHQTRPPQFRHTAGPAFPRTRLAPHRRTAFRSTAAPHHSLFRHTAIPQYQHRTSSFAQHPLFRHRNTDTPPVSALPPNRLSDRSPLYGRFPALALNRSSPPIPAIAATASSSPRRPDLYRV